ncbi:hypothetical protein PHET_01472 [Paragonimus heterotremus]|uniref:PPM-type phosphatase domain-containing protein n=1 Tax=Paragonimus heterotremus TaxID=100268 RepID=A0A8J4TDY7_9TREM|nr:hypothetical protein PHET_01472 [Paragonimus heterotremus]
MALNVTPKSKFIINLFSRLTVCRILNAYAHSYHKSELEHAFGSMVDSQKLLNLPLDNEESIEQGTLIPRIDLSHIGSASVLGRREYNEDRLLACQLSSHHLLLGVFDGHGGSAAAEFSRAMFPDCVQYELTSLRNWARKQGQSLRSADPKLFEPAMKRAFLQVNNLMMRHFFHYGTVHPVNTLTLEKYTPCFVHVSVVMPNRHRFISGRVHFIVARERQWSGTTATVVLLRHSHQLIVGHVGDSRALICRGGRIEALTVNHDPNNLTPLRDLSPGEHGTGLTESERIATFGGTVITNSLGVPVINGRLGMTRSLGDAELKAFGVTAHPQVSSIKVRHSNASFLTLVSDGVTYVMSDEEIQTIIAACRTPRDAAQSIVETAMLYGSDDNASALVIPFGYWGKYTPSNRRHGEDQVPIYPLNEIASKLSEQLKSLGFPCHFVVRAPGRVNLIGEHIDYNGYAVLPMALEQSVYLAVAVQPTGDSIVLSSSNPECVTSTVSIAEALEFGSECPPDTVQWFHYPLCAYHGIADYVKEKQLTCNLPSLVIHVGGAEFGGLWPAAGLSSSSALVVASAIAIMRASGLSIGRRELAGLCARCERYIGMQGGGMDQAASLLGSENSVSPPRVYFECLVSLSSFVKVRGIYRLLFVCSPHNSCVDSNSCRL